MNFLERILALAALASSTALRQRVGRRLQPGSSSIPASGPKAVRLEVYGDRTVRVTESPDGNVDVTPTAPVIAQPLADHSPRLKARRGDAECSRRNVARVSLADGHVSFADRLAKQTSPRHGPRSFAPVTIEGVPYRLHPPAVQSRHRRGAVRARPAPVRADELQRAGRRARPAQHGRSDPIRTVDAQLRAAVGQSVDHPLRQSRSLTQRPERPTTRCKSMAVSGWTATYAINGKQIAQRSRTGDRLSVSRRPTRLARRHTNARPVEQRFRD